MMPCLSNWWEGREPGAPEFIGGGVLLLYRYIIIANFFFLLNGVTGRGHLVFFLSLLHYFSCSVVGGLRGWADCTHIWIAFSQVATHPQDGCWDMTTSGVDTPSH